MPIRYFADVGNRALQFDRVDHRPDGNAYGYDKESKSWVQANRKVNYKSNPSKHECDARCQNATGKNMNCECSCGGKNHGKGFAAEDTTEADGSGKFAAMQKAGLISNKAAGKIGY